MEVPEDLIRVANPPCIAAKVEHVQVINGLEAPAKSVLVAVLVAFVKALPVIE